MKSLSNLWSPVIAAAFIFAGVAVAAEPSTAVKEDQAQLASDRVALQRLIKRLEADETKLKADKASGKMAAESKDSAKVFEDQQAVKGAKGAIAADKPGSLQMASDKATLQRALARLDSDQATLKADKASGKMAAESKDSAQVYKDQQAVKGEKKNIATDKTNLKADLKK